MTAPANDVAAGAAVSALSCGPPAARVALLAAVGRRTARLALAGRSLAVVG